MTEEKERTLRKSRVGVVVSNSMNQTIVVEVRRRVRHPKYGRTIVRTKKLYVHDEENVAQPGDTVEVVETRPLSKLKHWRLVAVTGRAR